MPVTAVQLGKHLLDFRQFCDMPTEGMAELLNELKRKDTALSHTLDCGVSNGFKVLLHPVVLYQKPGR